MQYGTKTTITRVPNHNLVLGTSIAITSVISGMVLGTAAAAVTMLATRNTAAAITAGKVVGTAVIGLQGLITYSVVQHHLR